MPIFSVYRHEKPGLDHIQQKLELFLAAVPVNMYLPQFIVHYLGTLLEKTVHRSVDQRLVAGNGR